MGSLGDNLLKITEFPFSYSFISLLALIFGRGLNFGDEDFFNKLGPLLILMGFVATTLSITDPIGRLQKSMLYGLSIYYKFRQSLFQRGSFLIQPPDDMEYATDTRIIDIIPDIGKPGRQYEIQRHTDRFTKMQIFGRTGGDIPRYVLVCLCADFQDILKRDIFQKSFIYVLLELTIPEVDEILHKLVSLKSGALGSTWVVREIDKITSMVYFAIVISTFILAEALLPDFLNRFLDTFQGIPGARTIIFLFSSGALIVLIIMIIMRLKELNLKAWNTFLFFIVLDAIKINREMYDKKLQDIEQYLSNGDWIMAEYWVKRVMKEYDGEVGKKEDYRDLGIY